MVYHPENWVRREKYTELEAIRTRSDCKEMCVIFQALDICARKSLKAFWGFEMTGEKESSSGRTFDELRGKSRIDHPDDHFSGSSGMLFEQAMAQTRMAICLTDPHQDDNPIVFVNRAFTELTGYSLDDAVGRNCRFLQGPDSDRYSIAQMRNAIESEDVVLVEVVNYRKDGTKFWNALHLGPIYDDDGKLKYYFGSQWDVTEIHSARADERHAQSMARELSHRLKNIFAVIGGIVTLTGRTYDAREVADVILGRIQALGRAHEPTLENAIQGEIELGQAIRAVLKPYDPEGKRIEFSGDWVDADPNVVSNVGLVLHELATNAVKHGSLSNGTGKVGVAWGKRPGNNSSEHVIELHWRESGGPCIDHAPETNGMGSDIVDRLIAVAGGKFERDWNSDGLTVQVELTTFARPTVTAKPH